jgi:hypothetical protein
MRELLVADPFLPIETRDAIARNDPGAREQLVELGINACEAAELLGFECEADREA